MTMSEYLVKVIEDSSGQVVKNLGPMPERKADKVFDGLMAQLNHDEYSVTMQQYFPKADYSS
jgi:hypothetical protein